MEFTTKFEIGDQVTVTHSYIEELPAFQEAWIDNLPYEQKMKMKKMRSVEKQHSWDAEITEINIRYGDDSFMQKTPGPHLRIYYHVSPSTCPHCNDGSNVHLEKMVTKR